MLLLEPELLSQKMYPANAIVAGNPAKVIGYRK